jgi:hypothetical protein
MASDDMTRLAWFMKIGSGIQVLLSYYVDNLRDCSVGITELAIYELRLSEGLI